MEIRDCNGKCWDKGPIPAENPVYKQVDPEWGKLYKAWYRPHETFRVGDREYRLTYSFDLDADGVFTHIYRPDCERIEGDKFVPCEDGEVSARRIYEELRSALDGWL